MFTIDQLPWNELNVDDELTLKCSNPFLRGVENELRQTIYKWNNFRADMVIMPHIPIYKTIYETSIGIDSNEDTLETDSDNSVLSRHYADELSTYEQLSKLKTPQVIFDKEKTDLHEAIAREIFDEILPVRMIGASIFNNVWDMLATYRGVTPLLYDIADRPEFIHAIMEKMTQIKMETLDQYEEKNLLEPFASYVHCTGAFTDELPTKDFDINHVKAKDVWVFGLAQMFSNCSPANFDEFEIQYAKKHLERFGLCYYGCCDPLDRKMDQVKKIKNVRKISMSPWANINIGAEAIGRDYVLSKKPNPAFLATPTMDVSAIKKEISDTLSACSKNNTPVEFILKDVSTVNYDPKKLVEYNKIIKSYID